MAAIVWLCAPLGEAAREPWGATPGEAPGRGALGPPPGPFVRSHSWPALPDLEMLQSNATIAAHGGRPLAASTPAAPSKPDSVGTQLMGLLDQVSSGAKMKTDSLLVLSAH